MRADASQSKLVVSFTQYVLLPTPEGWQWAELASLGPEGIASLGIVLHVRKDLFVLFCFLLFLSTPRL